MIAVFIIQTLNLLLYCYCGKIATESFEKMGQSAYDMNWQQFPIKLQRHFILIIGNAQRSLCYRAFGMTVDLETYTHVSVTNCLRKYSGI